MYYSCLFDLMNWTLALIVECPPPSLAHPTINLGGDVLDIWFDSPPSSYDFKILDIGQNGIAIFFVFVYLLFEASQLCLTFWSQLPLLLPPPTAGPAKHVNGT